MPKLFNCKHAASTAGFACGFNEIRNEVRLANPSGKENPIPTKQVTFA